MTSMPRTDALCIGIASIDQPHRGLVDATKRLHDEISQPAHRTEHDLCAAQALDRLLEFENGARHDGRPALD